MAGEPPILPGLDVIGAGKDALIAARPRTADHVDRGVYGDAFKGWRGQFGLARQGLAAEVQAARLSKASGDALRELTASNYDTPALVSETKAIGELQITRAVVHVRAGDGITAADATDGASAAALLSAIADAMNPHLVSLYSTGDGLGSHEVTDGTGPLAVIGTTTMGDLVDTANDFLTKINRHFSNQRVSDGTALSPAPHLDVDAAHVMTLAQMGAPSNPGGAFSVATKAEQQALLIALNTMKRAVNAHLALEAVGGTVQAGLKITLGHADAAGARLIPSADYEIAFDTYVPTGARSAVLPIVATVAGPQANVPEFLWVTQQITINGALFDDGASLPFGPAHLRAAGGSQGQSDAILRAAAAASWLGIYGPTSTALLAGCLRSSGVAHFVELDEWATGRAWVYVADEAWAQSNAWKSTVEQILRDDWLGVGQRATVTRATVLSEVVRVRLTVKLRDKTFLTDPTAITTAIQKALKSYFDDRRDWYIWKLASLRGVCTAADKRRILQVSSLVVLDRNGEPLSEPDAPSAGDSLTHWFFSDNGLEVSYVAPS